MNAELKLEIQKIQELSKKFHDITKAIADSGSLVAKAALTIERQAKMNWGEGKHVGGFPNVRTNRLRSSITAKVDSPTQAHVGTNVSYAPHVEYGHEIKGTRKLLYGVKHRANYIPRTMWQSGRSPAYPFLGPTIQQTKDDIGGVMVAFGKEQEDTFNK